MLRCSLSLLIALASPHAVAQTQTRAVFVDITPAVEPPLRSRAQMAYDEARGRVLMGGGLPPGSSSRLQDTWEYDGETWLQIVAPNQLNFGRPVRFVYSPQQGRVLAVIGENAIGPTPMRIHAWTGADWVLVDGNGPPSRGDWWNIAWDSDRGVLVLFGDPNFAETWEWDGSVWTQKGFGGPLPRRDHQMVYDADRQVVLVYGGWDDSTTAFTDLWEWNGVYWLQRFGLQPPGSSNMGTLVYESLRDTTVVFGGYGGTPGTAPTGQVWEFDGAQWQNVPRIGGPTRLVGACAAYAADRYEVVVFGGLDGPQWRGTQVFRVVTGTTAANAPHRPGCAGPGGVPTVVGSGGSRPVLGETWTLQASGMPFQPPYPIFMMLGHQDQTWNGAPLPVDLTVLGFTGCSLNLDPTGVEGVINIVGNAWWEIDLPYEPALDGVEVFVQAAGLAPGWNPAGVVFSDSLSGTLGAF